MESLSSKYVPPYRRPGFITPPAGFDTLDQNTPSTTERTARASQPAFQRTSRDQHNLSREANYRIKDAKNLGSLKAVCDYYVAEMNYPINICAALSRLSKLCDSEILVKELKNQHAPLIRSLLNNADSQIAAFDEAQLCILAWALGRLSINEKPLFDKISYRIARLELNVLQDKEICMLVNGFALAEQRDYTLFQVALRELNKRDLHHFRPDALATLCSAYGKTKFLEIPGDFKRLVEAVHAKSEFMTGQELCMVTSGFDCFRKYPDLIKKIADEICKRDPNVITSKGIFAIILGFSSLEYTGHDISHFILREIERRPAGDIGTEALCRFAQHLAIHEGLTKERFDLILSKAKETTLPQKALMQCQQAGLELYAREIEIQWPEWLRTQLAMRELPHDRSDDITLSVAQELAKINPDFQPGTVLFDSYRVTFFSPTDNCALLVAEDRNIKYPAKWAMKIRHLQRLGYTVKQMDPTKWYQATDKQALLRQILKKDVE